MRIGIPAYERGGMVGVQQDYLTFIERFGTPVIIPPYISRKDFFKTFRLEGLVLPGGADVDTRRYSKFPQWIMNLLVYPPDPALEWFDTQILPGIFHAGFPVFGICRGLQTLNVHFGGTLYPHLRDHPYSKHMTDLVHEISFTNAEGNIAEQRVNSFHHQAIRILGEGLESLAEDDGDGIIEAIRHETLPIYAVQWHPERLDEKLDPFSYSMASMLFGRK